MKNKQQIYGDAGHGTASIPALWDEEMKNISDLFGDHTNFVYIQLTHLRKLAVDGMETVTGDDRKALIVLDKLIRSAHNLTLLDTMLQTIVKSAEVLKEEELKK